MRRAGLRTEPQQAVADPRGYYFTFDTWLTQILCRFIELGLDFAGLSP